MTLTIDHPGRRHSIPVLPALFGLAITVLVAVVALQLSGTFASEEASTSPVIQSPSVNQGPNVGLAPDWTSQEAARVAATTNQGPNVGLAPDWTSQEAARVAATTNQGPNVGLAPDWTNQR